AVSHGRSMASDRRGCTNVVYRAPGVTYEIQFAKNGAVQQYVLTQSSHNMEQDHDTLSKLEAQYGPAGVNAPPLKIVSYRKGSGSMLVPDKAVDSCGRVTA